MGGNLFRPFGAKRLSKERMLELSNKITSRTNDAGIELQSIPSYNSKETFGDIDFVYSTRIDNYDDTLNPILELFKPAVYKVNGPITSIMIEEAQIDFVKVNRTCLYTAKDYFSYNDLGNLIGKIYHAYGISYGHTGLKYTLMDEAYKVGEVFVSQDTREIHEAIGLDFDLFVDGEFETLEDVFDYVCSSPYFHPDIFKWESLNSENRRRDKKRSSYNGFLQYIGEIPNEEGILRDSRRFKTLDLSKPPAKDDIATSKYRLLERFERYDSVIQEEDDMWDNHSREKHLKSFFNGKVVAEIVRTSFGVDIKDKALGAFMKFCKGPIENHLWDEIYNFENQTIPEHIREDIEMQTVNMVMRSFHQYREDPPGPTFLV